MEYVDGATLRELIAKGELDVPAAIEVGMQVADALGRAHEAGIVHRDIKSDNIMVTRDGHPKILDFGLAKLLDLASDSDPDATRLETLAVTQAGMVLGTVSYMSPEQARGMPADKRSDIFSFGVVLYEMATGRLPFQGQSALDTMHAIAFGATQPIHTIRTGLPFSLQRVIDRCLQKKPEDRYQDMHQATVDLRHVRREIETGVSAGRPLLERARGWTRGLTPKGTIWIGVAGFAIGGLLMAILGSNSNNKVAPFFVAIFFASIFYRKFRNRRQSAITRFARRAGKLPEVRVVTCNGSRFTVIVDRPTAKTYLKLNGFLAAANGHLFHGEGFTIDVREEVSDAERRTMLSSVGLHYAREDA
jgi:serine/threonine protein kinase